MVLSNCVSQFLAIYSISLRGLLVSLLKRFILFYFLISLVFFIGCNFLLCFDASPWTHVIQRVTYFDVYQEGRWTFESREARDRRGFQTVGMMFDDDTNTLSDRYGQTWHFECSDHTPDPPSPYVSGEENEEE